MRIDTLTIHGITTFRSPQTLDLAAIGPGIVAVAGPNGAGKTSLLEAIPGCLYRQTPSRGPVAGLATARDARIEVEMSNGAAYRAVVNVDAHSGKSEAFLFDAGGAPLAGPKVRDFDRVVAERFPPLSVYLASMFACQTGAGSILRMERAERRALFGRLLGLERLEALASEAKKRASAAESDLIASRAALEAIRSSAGSVDALRESLSEAAAERREIVERRDSSAAEVERLAAEVARLHAILADAQRAERTAQEARRRAEALDAKADAQAAEVARLEALMADSEAIEATARQIRCLAAAMDDARARGEAARARVDTLRAAVAEADRAADSLLRDAEKAQAAVQDCERMRCEAEAAAESARVATQGVPCAGRLDDGEREGCPALRAHFAARRRAEVTLAELPERRETAEAAAVALQSRLDATRSNLADRRSALAEAEADLRKIRAEYTAAKAEHDRLAPLDRSAKLATVAAELLAALKLSEALREQAAAATSEAQVAAAAVPVVNLEQIQNTEEAAELAKRNLATLTAQVNAWAADCARIEARLQDAEQAAAKIADLVSRVAPIERDLAEWRWLSRGLGVQGVQALEMDAAGPRVSDIANELLASAYGSRFQVRFETQAAKADGKGVKETFDVVVCDTERGREGDGSDLSGGEKVIVGEALGLAVGIFHGQAAGVELGTVIRDETVGALDPENADRYLSMLRQFLRVGRVHQLLFVAHAPALVDLADAVVRVAEGRISVEAGR